MWPIGLVALRAFSISQFFFAFTRTKMRTGAAALVLGQRDSPYQVLDISLIFCYRLLATLVLKTSDVERHRGFESLSLRR